MITNHGIEHICFYTKPEGQKIALYEVTRTEEIIEETRICSYNRSKQAAGPLIVLEAAQNTIKETN